MLQGHTRIAKEQETLSVEIRKPTDLVCAGSRQRNQNRCDSNSLGYRVLKYALDLPDARLMQIYVMQNYSVQIDPAQINTGATAAVWTK